MSYEVFYWLHIFSYVLWLLAFAASVFFGFKVRLEEDAIKMRQLMRSERLAFGLGTYVGALGILISGSVMAFSGPHWGWFDVVLYPWLALKQVLFIIILILLGFSVKRSVTFKKMLAEEEVASTETSKQWRRAYRISIIIYIFVVVDTFLGLMKPGIGM